VRGGVAWIDIIVTTRRHIDKNVMALAAKGGILAAVLAEG
jgi:hypothetical protein